MASAPLTLVEVSVADEVARLTINRPTAGNCLNPAVVHQLGQALAQAAGDPAIRGIVLAGAGKSFVLGADLDFFARNLQADEIDRIVGFTESAQRLINAIDDCPKPVVARVDGAALGAGTELVLACDLAIATPRAGFALPEVALGIYPGLGGTQRAPRRLGVGLARWMIYTAKIISPTEAWQAGLVDSVVGPADLDATCSAAARGELIPGPRPAQSSDLQAIAAAFANMSLDELLSLSESPVGGAAQRAARLIKSHPPAALRRVEHLIDAAARLNLPDGMALEISHLRSAFDSPEARRLLGLRGLQR